MLKKWLENSVRKVNVKEMTKTTYVKSMLKKWLENNLRKVNVKDIADKAIERHKEWCCGRLTTC